MNMCWLVTRWQGGQYKTDNGLRRSNNRAAAPERDGHTSKAATSRTARKVHKPVVYITVPPMSQVCVEHISQWILQHWPFIAVSERWYFGLLAIPWAASRAFAFCFYECGGQGQKVPACFGKTRGHKAQISNQTRGGAEGKLHAAVNHWAGSDNRGRPFLELNVEIKGTQVWTSSLECEVCTIMEGSCICVYSYAHISFVHCRFLDALNRSKVTSH